MQKVLLFGIGVVLASLTWGCSDNGGGAQSTESHGTDTLSDTELDTTLPESCDAAGATCGVIQLRDGQWADCGTCAAPQTCGAIAPNSCGCEPLTCAWAGADCGVLDDGCGHALECGSCSGLETCGGSFAPNVCAAPVCNDYCWCSVSPYPQADDLTMAYVDPDGALWLGGSEGQLLVRRDGNWELFDTYTRVPSDLYAMVLFGGEDGWVVGQNGAILKYEGTRFHCSYLDEEENTENWSPVKYDLYDLWAASKDSIWVTGEEGIVRWDGEAWAVVRSAAGALYAVAGRSEDELWFGGAKNNAPFLLHKQGEQFAADDLGLGDLHGAIRDLVFDEQGALFAVGETSDDDGAPTGGFLLRRTQENTWERLDQGDLPSGLVSGAFDGDGWLWAVGRNGAVATFDGQTARPAPPLWGNGQLNAVLRGKTGLVVVGETGLLAEAAHGFLFPNVAHSPVAAGQPNAASVPLSDDAQLSVGDGFALLWRGTSFGYAPVPAQLTGVFAVGPTTVFAAGNQSGDAVILRYDGARFTEVARAPSAVTTGIDGSSSTDVRARLADNQVLHFDGEAGVVRDADVLPPLPNKDARATPWTITASGFERMSSGAKEVLRTWPVDSLAEQPHRAVGTDQGELWAVGPDGAIRFDGTRWRNVARDTEMSEIALDQSGVAWITGTASVLGGPLWRFEDGALVDAGFDAEETLNAISITAQGEVFVAGDAIYQLVGDAWETVLPAGSEPVRDIAALSETDIWASRGFDVLRLEDGTWSTTPTLDLQDIDPLSEDHRVAVHTIVAIGPDEVLLAGETGDKGCFVMIGYVDGVFASRPMCSMYGEATLNDVWALSADEAWVTVGQVGYVYHYFHTVRMFDTVDAVTADPLGALWGNADGYKWAFGKGGVISRGVPITDPACQ